ncbi:hypothetical protein [Arachidicoccus ginsenosidimutans]|uniref:hypothetical protein n=1 Tax=Arachidicoccus sp. BS20 TaxID=1850526 RepID=UPI0012E836B3|nr:hypothetical protein [Arachidicoccus sp. BS20]
MAKVTNAVQYANEFEILFGKRPEWAFERQNQLIYSRSLHGSAQVSYHYYTN